MSSSPHCGCLPKNVWIKQKYIYPFQFSWAVQCLLSQWTCYYNRHVHLKSSIYRPFIREEGCFVFFLTRNAST